MESTSSQEMGRSRRWWIRLCQWLWGKRGFFWSTLIFGIMLNVFASWLYTPWSIDFKQLPIGWAFQNPLIILLVGICFLLLTSIIGLISRLDRTISHSHPTLPLSDQNRQWLLARVNAFWIEGLLEQSLHEATLIELELSEQHDAIMNPWRLAMQEIDRPARPLSIGTSILQVYDLTDGELLILGEPGTGKTTLLLQLARDLLDRARQNDTHPMPVIFNLSSWA